MSRTWVIVWLFVAFLVELGVGLDTRKGLLEECSQALAEADMRANAVERFDPAWR